MVEIVKLGSLYFNGQPQEVGVGYNEEQISFGPAVPGKELQWVKLKSGLLILDRCICVDVSWEQLNAQGLILGTPVQINGVTYLCRCLRVGPKEDSLNEWDSALDEAGESNNLWHWKKQFFWGQENSKYEASSRAVRGWDSARFWYFSTATHRSVNVGFRPALEPLGSELCSPVTLVGKKAKAYCPDGVTIEGHLVDFSDYDVILDTDSPVPADCPWIAKDGCNIIISRQNITWLKES